MDKNCPVCFGKGRICKKPSRGDIVEAARAYFLLTKKSASRRLIDVRVGKLSRRLPVAVLYGLYQAQYWALLPIHTLHLSPSYHG